MATGHEGVCGRWPLRHQPGGRVRRAGGRPTELAASSTETTAGRVASPAYGRGASGGELGDFTARTSLSTRSVGSARGLNASRSTNTSSETKAVSTPTTIHGTPAVASDEITTPAAVVRVSVVLMVPPWTVVRSPRNSGAPLLMHLRAWCVRGFAFPLAQTEVTRGRTAERGDPLAGGLVVRSGYEHGRQTCRLRQVQH